MLKSKKIIIMLVGVAMIILLVVATTNESKQKVLNTYLNKILDAIKSKKIHIQGKIVDQDGNFLKDVRITVIASQSIMFFAGEDKEKKIISKNGFFDYIELGHTSLYLDFRKKGYYPIYNKSYGLKQKLNSQQKEIQYNSADYLDEVITMHKIGEISKIKKSQVLWSIPLDTLLVPIIKLPKFTTHLINADQIDKKDKYFKIIKGKELTNIKYNEAPNEYFLEFYSPEIKDGFIKTRINPQTGFKALTDAPVSGYNLKKIKLNFTNGDQYFYIRNGDQYGKMKLHYAYCNNQKTFFRLVIDIIENTETDLAKKRNLAQPY